MKNKKGFTIVELVIVIAVIAILAAVLIPTFSGVIQKATESSAQQQAASAEKIALAMSTDATLPEKTAFVIFEKDVPKYFYQYVNNKLAAAEREDVITGISLTGYNVTMGSIIVSNDYFIPNDSNKISTLDQYTKVNANTAGADVKELISKLISMSGTMSKNFEDIPSDKTVYYKLVRNADKTGYVLTVGYGSDDAVPTAAAFEINVFTSVDLAESCIIFVPEYTKTNNT